VVKPERKSRLRRQQARKNRNSQSEISFDILALATSAGGLAALSKLLSMLPRDFPAAIVIVQHLDPRHRSALVDILSRRTPLHVKSAENGEQIRCSTVYVAPPNNHLLVEADGTLRLSKSEMVHFLRPCADLLFESVAASYKERAIAIVLTGTGSDGKIGVEAIKKLGGTVIVQNKESSEFFGMPDAALQTGCADFVLPIDEIAGVVNKLVMN
jgi:two-component system, chemotaxis family, protein-glutamate methylesterase/glutaminase